MTTYAITYDLHQPGQDYDDLYETIKDYGWWWHHQDSIWLVNTSTASASEIRDDLMDIVDTNDQVLVFEASTPWAEYGHNDSATDWLHDFM